MTKHKFTKDKSLEHNLKIKVKDSDTAQVYCRKHNIAVAEFVDDILRVIGGTCLRKGGQLEEIDLDRQDKFEPLDVGGEIYQSNKKERIEEIIDEADNMTSSEINRAMGKLSEKFSVQEISKADVRDKFEEMSE